MEGDIWCCFALVGVLSSDGIDLLGYVSGFYPSASILHSERSYATLRDFRMGANGSSSMDVLDNIRSLSHVLILEEASRALRLLIRFAMSLDIGAFSAKVDIVNSAAERLILVNRRRLLRTFSILPRFRICASPFGTRVAGSM